MRAFPWSSRSGWACAIALLAMVTPLAAAGPVVRDLGGGWRATIIQPDISDLIGVGYNPDTRTLTVEKTARFEDIDEFTLQPAPINILFTQTAADASTANRIALTSATITNMTGVNWTSFKEILLDSGQVAFNPALSAGFSITPFTTRTYSGGNTEVEFAGGVVPNGAQWFPGQASGELVIDVDLSSATPVSFTLKELPVPEPTTAIGLLLAAAALARRRTA